jgi:hypothetical protein
MNEIQQVAASELSPADSRTWIGRIVIGIALGEAIWGFLASITANLVLPAMARFMGGDAQSPLYLGKGDFNVAALFISLLELCFAGIVAVIVNSLTQKAKRVGSRTVRTVRVARPAASPVSPAANTAAQANSAETAAQAAQPSPQVAEPAKQKPPKKVYYNIVGEPVETDDE